MAFDRIHKDVIPIIKDPYIYFTCVFFQVAFTAL